MTDTPSGDVTGEAEQLRRERDAWIETARQHCKNEEFWRGLVYQIGETFGVEAKTSDDGSVQQDVLGLKVPELVAALAARLEEAEKELGKLKADMSNDAVCVHGTDLTVLRVRAAESEMRSADMEVQRDDARAKLVEAEKVIAKLLEPQWYYGDDGESGSDELPSIEADDRNVGDEFELTGARDVGVFRFRVKEVDGCSDYDVISVKRPAEIAAALSSKTEPTQKGGANQDD